MVPLFHRKEVQRKKGNPGGSLKRETNDDEAFAFPQYLSR